MPGFSVIKKVKKGELRPISDLGITPESTRLGGSLPVGGGGAKGAIKLGAKAIKAIRKKLKEKKK